MGAGNGKPVLRDEDISILVLDKYSWDSKRLLRRMKCLSDNCYCDEELMCSWRRKSILEHLPNIPRLDNNNMWSQWPWSKPTTMDQSEQSKPFGGPMREEQRWKGRKSRQWEAVPCWTSTWHHSQGAGGYSTKRIAMYIIVGEWRKIIC